MSRFNVLYYMKSQLLQLYIFWHFTIILRFLCMHLCLLPFSPKRFISLLFTQSSDSVGWPHGGDRREVFANLSLQIAVKCIFLGPFFNFRVLLTVVKKSLLERHLQPSFIQTVTKISEQNGKSFQGYSKTKKKKKTYINRLNLVT